MATRRKFLEESGGGEVGSEWMGAPSWRGDPRDKWVSLAQKRHKENQLDEAIRCYNRVLRASSDRSGVIEHAGFRRGMVECLCAKGEYSQALVIVEEMKRYLFSEVTSISKELERIRLLAATINLQIGSYRAAELECRHLLQDGGDDREGEQMREILMTLGSISLYQGDLLLARRYYEDCLNYLGDKDKSLELAKVLNHLAQLHFIETEWAEALELLTRSLRISESLGDGRLTASVIGNMGTVQLLMGEWAEAEENLKRSLDMWEGLGDLLAIVRKYISLGNLCTMRREWKKADDYYSRSRTISREKGYKRELALACEFSGELAFDEGKLDLARRYYNEALALVKEIAPEGDLMGEIYRRIAEVQVKTGDLTGALESCERSHGFSLRMRDRYEEGIVYRVFGQIYEAWGETERARSYFSQGIDSLAAIGEQYERGKTLYEAALFLTDRYASPGDFRTAERHFREAAAIFGHLGVEYFSEMIRKGEDRLRRKQTAPSPA